MLIISLANRRTVISKFLAARNCARCFNDVQHLVVFHRKHISLYFVIPLLSYDKRWVVECPICYHSQPITRERAYSDCPLPATAGAA